MQTSEAGMKYIMKHEGCMLCGYQIILKSGKFDAPTIGYGHVFDFSHPGIISPAMGDVYRCGSYIKSKTVVWTQEQAEEAFKKDIVKYEAPVKKFAAEFPNDMTQGMFDALVSRAYNCGGGRVTSLIKIAKQYGVLSPQIKDALLKPNTCQGQVLKALARRRQEECDMYFGQSTPIQDSPKGGAKPATVTTEAPADNTTPAQAKKNANGNATGLTIQVNGKKSR